MHQGGEGAEGTRRSSVIVDRYLDELTSTLTEADARLLVDLLKLAALDRVQAEGAKETIANVLIALGTSSPSIADMLIETCITELEDTATNYQNFHRSPAPIVQETSHPYIDDITLTG